MKNTKLYINKPVYLGMSISDLSKSLMYYFHYNYIKTKYWDKAKLLFTDTDSLAYMKLRPNILTKISTPTLRNGLTLVTTQLIHPSGIKTELNSKVLGMFKDEAGGKKIVEFVGLRAKLYFRAIKILDGSEDKKCKGVTKNITKRSIQFDD